MTATPAEELRQLLHTAARHKPEITGAPPPPDEPAHVALARYRARLVLANEAARAALAGNGDIPAALTEIREALGRFESGLTAARAEYKARRAGGP